MKKQIRSWFLSLLCLLLILALTVSCTPDNGASSDTSATESESSVPEGSFVLDTASVAVISTQSTNSASIKAALSLLGDACKAYFGRPMKSSDDWYRGEMERNAVEILIGTTNRPESIAAAEGLTYHDYTYEVLSSGVVVICGGSDEATLAAMARFLKDCYGFENEKAPGAFCDLPVGTSYTYRHEYTVTEFLLCGKPIDTYTIVHKSDKKSIAQAEILRLELERICGKEIPLVTNTAYKSGNAILLGMSDPDGTCTDRDLGAFSYLATHKENGGDTLFILDSKGTVDEIVSSFVAEHLRTIPQEKTVNLAFSDQIFCSRYTDLTNQLQLAGQPKDESIGDGVIYRHLVYTDKNGEPVLAFAIEADLSKVSVLNATPGNGEAIQNVKATTKQAMQALASAGYTVLAGVNADFFRINGDYSPQGLCIKNGKELSVVNGRPWFGVKADGTPVIGAPDDYTATYKGNLQQAVGGSHILLKDGVYYDLGVKAGLYGTDFASIRHPRTAVGFTADGKLILLVVDGRQPAHSNGASLADLAAIMLSLGATDALNLDGGGSSTMITYANGNYTTKNKPSDGSLRSVYNSLVLVRK